MALVGMNQIVELRSHYVDVIWELEDPPVETIQQFQVSPSVAGLLHSDFQLKGCGRVCAITVAGWRLR